MTAYYNEWDKFAAQWLRNLIAAGHIAPGVVDDRSITDVRPSDLRGFTQCHFFAGIGVWSLALRRAGWADDRRVWTASCPCQPFSSAGDGAGFDDKRHLWPHLHYLITQCRPADVIGEQVASKDAEPWLDLVQTDMEGLGYAFGAVAFPAASVGAPHIRDRTYWVALAEHGGCEGRQSAWRGAGAAVPPGSFGELVIAAGAGLEGSACGGERPHAQHPPIERAGAASDLAHHHHRGRANEQGLRLRGSDVHDADGRGPLGGFWADAEWIPCRDGKWRPVEPGTFPLAHGVAGRVGQLRAYGNAIVAPQAQIWIETVMECMPSVTDTTVSDCATIRP